MTPITEAYMEKCTIEDSQRRNTVAQIVDFLSQPDSVAAMITMCRFGEPALSGVVKELETEFENRAGLSFTDDADKMLVGTLVKKVMEQFGYTPIGDESQLKEISSFSGARFFHNASVYKKTNNNPMYSLRYDD